MWSPVIGEELILEKELTAHSHNKFVVIKDSQMSCTPLENSFIVHVVLYYTEGLYHLLSGVCHITGRKWKGKGLGVSCT